MRSDDERKWAWEEFRALEVRDVRLRPRVKQMARRAMERGGGRISDVFCNGAERQGAYDLLEGGRVAGETLIEAMAVACVQRSADAKVVFVPIDGSSIHVVDRRKRTDLGLVGTYANSGRGLQVVSALAISLAGTPLGVCAQTWWARPTKRRKRGPSTYRPIEERESRFVVQTIRDVQGRYAQTDCMPWIVIDRGGDATVILDELVKGRCLFTVRASWNRRIRPGMYLRESLGKQRVQLRYDVDVPAGHKRTARRARMAVRVATVELNVSHDWQAQRANPTVNVVWAREMDPPRGEKPLDWMLFTNHAVDTLEDLRLVIRGYCQRWRIEDFHKTWKTGHCHVEDSQLRADRTSPSGLRFLPPWPSASNASSISPERHRKRPRPSSSPRSRSRRSSSSSASKRKRPRSSVKGCPPSPSPSAGSPTSAATQANLPAAPQEQRSSDADLKTSPLPPDCSNLSDLAASYDEWSAVFPPSCELSLSSARGAFGFHLRYRGFVDPRFAQDRVGVLALLRRRRVHATAA